MRHLLVVVSLFLLPACDPGIKQFDVTPSTLPCPGKVKVAWSGEANGGHLDADSNVLPHFPPFVPKQGTLIEFVPQTTMFTFYYPGGAHRHRTVTVQAPVCPTDCGPQVMTFTGTCPGGGSGPIYDTNSLSAAVAPGNIKDIWQDADVPVHVTINGVEIALNAAGGPIFPLPQVAAAGTYFVTIPGQVGMLICNGNSGTGGGGGQAPEIHVTVTPTCPIGK